MTLKTGCKAEPLCKGQNQTVTNSWGHVSLQGPVGGKKSAQVHTESHVAWQIVNHVVCYIISERIAQIQIVCYLAASDTTYEFALYRVEDLLHFRLAMRTLQQTFKTTILNTEKIWQHSS